MKPYYDHAGITIYYGEAREIVPYVIADAIVTDPVWPNNAVPEFADVDAPRVFAEVMGRAVVARAAIHLGCTSDPSMLSAVRLPFFRVVSLEYACPHYMGRLLYTGDMAYLYGEPPPAAPGFHVVPGKVTATDKGDRVLGHPTPRAMQHVRFLVGRWGRGRILDPFMGSGTTLVAAKDYGYSAVGIEREERYCEIAAKRLAQEVLL